MKKLLSLTFLTVMALSIAAADANAQTAFGISIVCADSVVCGNVGTRTVDGYSGTWLDYYAGLYYDPEVAGHIYRTDNPEILLSSGRHIGYADIIPAEVYLRTTNYVEGKTYCTFSMHSIWSYYYYPTNNWWFDPFRYSLMSTGYPPWGGFPYSNYYTLPRRHVLGTTQACITIPIPPPPTPTPIPPTPTPTPEPTPTPPPCNPLEDGSCFPEYVIVNVASPIRPTGVTNGTNKAMVSVQVCTGLFCGTPLPNRNVELTLTGITNSGGHIDSGHTGPRPIGRLEKTSGTTGSNGFFFTNFSPSHISGIVRIEARSGNRSGTKDLVVGVLGLTQLIDGTNFKINPNPDTAHPSNNWGSVQTNNSFPRIADAYKTEFYGSNPMPENDKLIITEISLVFGGKFDLKSDRRGIPRPNWHNLAAVHKYHREGNSIDLRCCISPGFIPVNRRVRFRQIGFENGATGVLFETSPEHYHLSFNNESNNVQAVTDPLNTHTPHSFIENAWEGGLFRFATQEEWERWHDRLVLAKSQGPAELLAEAKTMEKEIFASINYGVMSRTNEEFVEDVFWSHLFREPTEAESAYWVGFLQNQPPTVPQNRRRSRLIDEFQLLEEFEALIFGIVDGEIIMPPTPTPTPTP